MATKRLADALNEKVAELEKPIELSWSFGDPVIACSVPREVMTKYASVLQGMRFEPGKKKYDHCWYIRDSDRFRHSPNFVKAVAKRLMDAGAEVEINYEGASMKMDEILRSKEKTMQINGSKLRRIIREEIERKDPIAALSPEESKLLDDRIRKIDTMVARQIISKIRKEPDKYLGDDEYGLTTIERILSAFDYWQEKYEELKAWEKDPVQGTMLGGSSRRKKRPTGWDVTESKLRSIIKQELRGIYR